MDALQGELPGWVAAYFEIAHLKQLYRQGWLRKGIHRERCKSVAEHTFGTALLAWWLAQAYFPDLDSVRVLRLALLHDLGEVYAGDLIPEEGVPPAEKHHRELESLQKIFAKLPEGKLYLQLWLEFEEGSTSQRRASSTRWTAWRWRCKPACTKFRATAGCRNSSTRLAQTCRVPR